MTNYRQMMIIVTTLALVPFLPDTKPLYSTKAREDDSLTILSESDSETLSDDELESGTRSARPIGSAERTLEAHLLKLSKQEY